MALVGAASPVEVVLARLTKVKATGKRAWMACCPAHEDRTPSLSITEGRDQRALLRCHAGCTVAAIVAAIGLRQTDLFVPSSDDRRSGASEPAPATTRTLAMVKTYDYTDEHGALLFQVCRYVDASTKEKTFRQRKPVGNGDWSWEVKGVRQVPYRLPQLLEAIACDRPVFIVEGEKDVETLEQLGYTATTNAGGAKRWRDEFSPYFKDAFVAVLPDNDDTGRQHAEQVAASLAAEGAMVRVVPLPGLPVKGDVSDWLERHTREELDEAVRRAPRWSGPTVSPKGLPYAVRAIDAKEPEPITWCVEDLLIAGELAVFAGDGGSFKSTAGFQIAGAVAGGYAAFNCFPTRQRPALILSAEDGEGVVLNRLDALVAGHGWDRERVLSNVHIIASHEAKLSNPDWQAHLIAEALRLDVGYIQCDPLFDLVEGDENSNSDLRPVISFCRKLATATNAAVVIVHHATKQKPDQRAIDRVRGASALRDASRCLLFFESRPEGVAVEHLKMSRSEKLAPFMLTREIESTPESRAIWSSARFSFQTTTDAVLSRAESFVLDQITASPGILKTADLRHAAAGSSIRGEDVSRALSTLQARGLIDYDRAPRNGKLWRPRPKSSLSTSPWTDSKNESVQPVQSQSGRLQHTTSESVQPAHPTGGRQAGQTSRSGQAGQTRRDWDDDR